MLRQHYSLSNWCNHSPSLMLSTLACKFSFLNRSFKQLHLKISEFSCTLARNNTYSWVLLHLVFLTTLFFLVMDLHSSFNLALDEDHTQHIFILKDPKTKWKLTYLQTRRSILINSEMQSAVAWIAAIV